MTAIPSTAQKQGRVKTLGKFGSTKVSDRNSAEAALYEEMSKRSGGHSQERNLELLRRHRAGDTSVEEQLVKENLPLVHTIAMQHVGQGLELMDLFQVGSRGLLKAIRRFDPSISPNFGGYATYGILREIKGSKAKLRGQRVSLTLYRLWQQILMVERAYRSVYQREPTTREIAERLGIGDLQVGYARVAIEGGLSLDDPVAGRDDDSRIDHISAGGLDPLDTLVAADELRNSIELLSRIFTELRKRNKRWYQRVWLFYGLDRCLEERTLEEVAAITGITRERVRQVRNRVSGWVANTYRVDLAELCQKILMLVEVVGDDSAIREITLTGG